MHAGIARSIQLHGEPVATPALLLSGGETTVTLGSNASGRGGRNTTFLLGLGTGARCDARDLGDRRRYRRDRWDG